MYKYSHKEVVEMWNVFHGDYKAFSADEREQVRVWVSQK